MKLQTRALVWVQLSAVLLAAEHSARSPPIPQLNASGFNMKVCRTVLITVYFYNITHIHDSEDWLVPDLFKNSLRYLLLITLTVKITQQTVEKKHNFGPTKEMFPACLDECAGDAGVRAAAPPPAGQGRHTSWLALEPKAGPAVPEHCTGPRTPSGELKGSPLSHH